MTDRELLEKAARAAGYSVRWCRNGVEGEEIECFVFIGGPDDGQRWQPNEDDGDALRLAVALGISFRKIGNKAIAVGVTQCDEYLGADPCQATRRAIVRAAAAMEPTT